MKQMVLKSENMLVDVLEEYEFAGVKRYRVRDAKSKSALPRVFSESGLREVTEEDTEHIVYLYTDEDTGEVHSMKLHKEFISAVIEHLGFSSLAARTTKYILDKMNRIDSDGNRRQFRAAVAYWIEKGIVICSTTSGYFIAVTPTEVDSCVQNKERQARANLRRAQYLRGMDLSNSIALFQSEVTKQFVAAA